MTTKQRILMKPDAEPCEIMTSDGRSLGWFMAGLGYWVTPENCLTVEKVLDNGSAVLTDPATAPFAPMNISTEPSEVSGSVTIGA